MRYRRFEYMKRRHDYHRTPTGCWMFKNDDGNWNQFHDDEHFANTVETGCEVRFFSVVFDMALPAAIL